MTRDIKNLEYEKSVSRHDFWKPLTNTLEGNSMCNGHLNYPAIRLSAEEFQRRMDWLKTNIEPLIRLFIRLGKDEERKTFLFLSKNYTDRLLPEQKELKKDIIKVWKQRPTGRKYTPQTAKVLDEELQEILTAWL